MKPHVTDNNKAGDSAPPNARGSMFFSSRDSPSTKAASIRMYSQPSFQEPTDLHEMSSEKKAHAYKVMTEEFNMDPIKARMLLFDHPSVWIRRDIQKDGADMFRKEYVYGSGKDKKTSISRVDTLSWEDESSGIIWVGVHGIDSICVVTRSGDLDMTRLRGSLDHLPMHKVSFNLRKSLIVEIEDLADPSSKLHQRFHQKIEKPFGVVSVIPYTYKQASSTEYGEMKAMEFLQEQLNSDRVFTVNETIQTAISAFQHLFQKKFNTDEIQVSVMNPEYFVTDKHKDPTVEELNMDQINEHLDVINKGCPMACIEDSCSDDSRRLEAI